MKALSLFKEYVWLVNTIRKNKNISLSEINSLWVESETSEGIDITRNTFIRHKRDIEEIFGITIECDRRNEYKYYIENEHVLDEESVQNWMISTLSVSNMLSDNIKIFNRIVLESVPSGGLNLQLLLEAMKKKVHVIIEYQKYSDEIPYKVLIAPYCLRLFACRWYMIGQYQRYELGEKRNKGYVNKNSYTDHLKTYSLDRIKNVCLTVERYEIAKDFNANDYFKDYFGVFSGNSDISLERIVIRAFGVQRCYIRDLPWHVSQEIIDWKEDYADFEFHLYPTNDFISHIIKFGEHVKVISPENVANKVKGHLSAALALYDV